MIRKKIDNYTKYPIQGKTYEVGDKVTILDEYYLPGTTGYDYRFGLYEFMFEQFGGKKWIISGKVQSISARKYKVPDDGCTYYLKGIEDFRFSTGMFKESYKYDKKKD